jgi:plastocyanin
MPTPSELAEHVDVGDTIEWQTETSNIEATTHTVVEVQKGQDKLKILVEGERGGQYRLLIHQDGGTDAYYVSSDGEEKHYGPLTEVTIYTPVSEYSHSW